MSKHSSPKFWVIIPAAGIGSRMQADQPKQYLEIENRTILEHTVQCFLSRPEFQAVAIGLAAQDTYFSCLSLSSDERVMAFEGGVERAQTVLKGLESLASEAKPNDWVWVHDAARPCLSHDDIDALIDTIGSVDDGALLGVPIHDTIKRADDDYRSQTTVDRRQLWRALTPQVFRYSVLLNALKRCSQDNIVVTDESSAVEYCGGRPYLVVGSEKNIKVTRPVDLSMAKHTLMEKNKKGDSAMHVPRIGTGFDVHAFGDGEFITLGGVVIPYKKGLIAHSDGDVLLHAVMDALLGALALGDIGKHFPDTDVKWKGANSRELLIAVNVLLRDKGYRVSNLDTTIMAQAPKMAPHIQAMREAIAADLNIQVSDISVKATTTEKLGFTGRSEGIACQASVVLVPLEDSSKSI